MAGHRGLFVRQLPNNQGTTPVEARRALAGLFVENSPGVPRSGLLSQSEPNVVIGNTTMSYKVKTCSPVICRTPGEGVYMFSIVGETTVPTTPAPPLDSRWDLIYVKQNDIERTDPDNYIDVGVVQGQVAANPVEPWSGVPSGGLVLAKARVGSGAANTVAAGVTITQVFPHTALNGTPVKVRNDTERATLVPFVGLQVARLDRPGTVEDYTNTGWRSSGPAGWTSLQPYFNPFWEPVYSGPNQPAYKVILDGRAVLIKAEGGYTKSDELPGNPPNAYHIMNSLPAIIRPTTEQFIPGLSDGFNRAQLFVIKPDGRVSYAGSWGTGRPFLFSGMYFLDRD